MSLWYGSCCVVEALNAIIEVLDERIRGGATAL